MGLHDKKHPKTKRTCGCAGGEQDGGCAGVWEGKGTAFQRKDGGSFQAVMALYT